jgi:GT2 family glycosyltransferase
MKDKSSSNSNSPTVSVVIPNWNGKDVIGDCLKSLQKQSYKLAQVIVVENGSVDGSIEYIEKNFPEVILLKQPKNLGFAGGVNVGIKAAQENKSDYVWLLNNDATADKDCLKNLLRTATKQSADIVASVILTRNDTIIDSDGDTYGMYGLPFPRHRNAPASQVPKADEPIVSASGGASLYKTSLFDEIGYFDEMFFAYYEDVDLSMRAQLRGKKIWLSHNAIVHHRMNHTADRIPGFGQEMTIKNSIYLFWKIIPFPLILRVFPRFLYANWRVTAITALRGHPWRAVRAHLVAAWHTPQLMRARKQIQGSRTISPTELEALLDKRNPFRALKKLDRSTPKTK